MSFLAEYAEKASHLQGKYFPSIDYSSVSSKSLSWQDNKPKYLLWTAIAPATTFALMIFVAFCFWCSALAEPDAKAKSAKYQSANAFFAWGVVGLAAYALLARMTRRGDGESGEDDGNSVSSE